MKKILSIICKLKGRPVLLFLLAFLLLLLLFLLRRWLDALLWFYLALLILLGLISLVRLAVGVLTKLCWKWTGSPKGKGSENHPVSKPVYIPPDIYKRPDPLIYSQSYLMAKGLAVTWDNPDIVLFDGALLVMSHELLPGKTYSIHANIYNGSTEAAAVNMVVRFYYLSFGIGAARNYIGETLVDVPVKGAAGLPALAKCPWTTPGAAGHYCIQVELVWPDDSNPANNLGQENVNVKKLNSPNATFQFILRNDSVFQRTIQLRADSYIIPPKDPCKKGGRDPGKTNIAIRHDPLAKHRLDAHPPAPGWTIDYISGDTYDLRPGEEQQVTVKFTAFDTFTGRQAFNINGFANGELVGGVTLYAHS